LGENARLYDPRYLNTWHIDLTARH
jgi:hypothetical protein